jgi:transposase-like protein
MSGNDWRRAELESLWFARVQEGLELLRQQLYLTWADVADRYRCGASTLREWRKRYQEAHPKAS